MDEVQSLTTIKAVHVNINYFEPFSPYVCRQSIKFIVRMILSSVFSHNYIYAYSDEVVKVSKRAFHQLGSKLYSGVHRSNASSSDQPKLSWRGAF